MANQLLIVTEALSMGPAWLVRIQQAFGGKKDPNFLLDLI